MSDTDRPENAVRASITGYSRDWEDKFGAPPKPFAKNTPCPKCKTANDDENPFRVGTSYNRATRLLTRTCTVCGYKWFEKPADAPTEEEPRNPEPQAVSNDTDRGAAQ